MQLKDFACIILPKKVFTPHEDNQRPLYMKLKLAKVSQQGAKT